MSVGFTSVFVWLVGGVAVREGTPAMSDTVRRIKLQFFSPLRVRLAGFDSFRVKVVASDGNLIPNEIFGFQRTLIAGDVPQTCDEFQFVCSAYDLSIYPVDEPDPEQSPQFFRKDTIDILVPGVGAADEAMADIEAQVCRLITTLNLLDNLDSGSVVWCPGPPPDDESDTSDTSS